jgi:hypothetical protein
MKGNIMLEGRINKPTKPMPTKKAIAWHVKNKWFGQDKFKTLHALIMHEVLICAGVSPNTKPYYESIDKYMGCLKSYGLDKEKVNE